METQTKDGLWSLKCARSYPFVFFLWYTARFTDSSHYLSYCSDCAPKCRRTKYRTSAYSVPFNHFFLRRIHNVAHNLPDTYHQLQNIQKFYTIYQLNPTVFDMILQTDSNVSSAFRYLSELRECLQNYLPIIQAMTFNMSSGVDFVDILSATKNVSDNIRLSEARLFKSYLLSGFAPAEGKIEDFRVRLIVTLLSDTNNFTRLMDLLETSVSGLYNYTAVVSQLKKLVPGGQVASNMTMEMACLWDTVMQRWGELLLNVDQARQNYEDVKLWINMTSIGSYLRSTDQTTSDREFPM